MTVRLVICKVFAGVALGALIAGWASNVYSHYRIAQYEVYCQKHGQWLVLNDPEFLSKPYCSDSTMGRYAVEDWIWP